MPGSSNGNGSDRIPGEGWPSAGVGARPVTTPVKEALPKRAGASVWFLLDAGRRRRGGRLALWAAVVALALGGVGLLAYPFATDLWAGRIQTNLERTWTTGDQAARIRAYQADSFAIGDALSRIRIPKLDVNTLVVEGISGNALRAGTGHYPSSALPGDPTGNVGIAGHRTGFGEPFRHLDRLGPGDDIWLETPVGRYHYQVIPPFDGHDNPWITTAEDWTVITTTAEPMLTLTTCDPPGTSRNRLIVRARLVRTLPAAS
jgi:LPXTG-site transpeptidase (sortase) family protein